ncbi:MAG: ankyrin repeat domain-containing protein [Planctomycetes bacterium]|nr:ankyrin repeat domain-containing protein [Planctomycetota bacterium]
MEHDECHGGGISGRTRICALLVIVALCAAGCNRAKSPVAGSKRTSSGSPIPSGSLQEAVFNDDTVLLRQRIDAGADLNGLAAVGEAPLHYAAQIGRLEAARILLDAGADVNVLTKAVESEKQWVAGGVTPLHYAAGNGRDDVAELLIARGARINAQEGELGSTPLHWAAAQRHLGAMRLLLGHGADPNARDAGARAPLHEAAAAGDIEGVRLLLSHAADPLARENGGETAGDTAARLGHSRVTELLRDAEAAERNANAKRESL